MYGNDFRPFTRIEIQNRDRKKNPKCKRVQQNEDEIQQVPKNVGTKGF